MEIKRFPFLLFVFDTTLVLKAHEMDLMKNTEASNSEELSMSELMSELCWGMIIDFQLSEIRWWKEKEGRNQARNKIKRQSVFR